MNRNTFTCTLILATLLTACGDTESEPNDNTGITGNNSPSSSTVSSASSTQTPSTGSGLGFSKLPNGKGGWNYEPSEISTAMRPNYDRSKSIKAFKGTLYKHLIKSGCQACHSSQGGGEAPLHNAAWMLF